MRYVCLMLLVCWMNGFAGDTDWVVIPDSLDPMKAKAVIDEVRAQMLVYYQDRGVYPGSVEQLIEAKYIDPIDSTTLSQWKFEIGYVQYPTFIKAVPKVLREGDPGKMRKVDYWYFKENSLTYEVSTGLWKGLGVKDFRDNPPTTGQKLEFTKDVREAIDWISYSVETFYNDRGVYPKDVEELVDTRYVLITPAVYVQWDLQLIGSPPTQIKAISSHIMPDGQGKVLTYDIDTKAFSGYGVEEE